MGTPIANMVDFDVGIIMQDLGQVEMSQDAGTVLMAACRSILQLNITMGTVVKAIPRCYARHPRDQER